jgi:hypothetical protein
MNKDGERVRFKAFMAATTKNAIFWDVALCGLGKNRSFGEAYCFHHKGDKNRRTKDVSSN